MAKGGVDVINEPVGPDHVTKQVLVALGKMNFGGQDVGDYFGGHNVGDYLTGGTTLTFALVMVRPATTAAVK